MNERIRADAGAVEIVGEVTYGPFSNPRFRSILKHFGKSAFGRSSACMEMENFLNKIHAGGKCCLEIGTFHGISTVLLSQYFETVVAISVDENPSKLLKHQIVEHLGIKNIVFHDVKSNEEKRELADKLDFDFAYQDGDHTHDTESDFDLLKRCGRILFHEYWPLQPSVWNLVNTLPQEQVIRAQFDCFAYWDRHG